MGLISVDQLKKDMVLANDVKDLSGRLLAGKGLKLTDGHLRLFKAWGILEADIEGESSRDTDENALVDLDPGLLKTAEELVSRRFMHSDLDHPANYKLFQLCVLQTAERLGRDKGLSEPRASLEGDEEPKSDDNGGQENYRIDPVRFVQQVVSLPALPVIISEMMEIIRDPNSSARKMAEAIGRDVRPFGQNHEACKQRILWLPIPDRYAFPGGGGFRHEPVEHTCHGHKAGHLLREYSF